MKSFVFITLATIFLFKSSKGQNTRPSFPTFNTFLTLENKVDTAANISLGDLNGDGHLDIVLIKGRHWPIIDQILLGDGKGRISKTYGLGIIPDRSYAGCLADFNGDGFLDIAVSNDDPDPKLIYLNDGHGHFGKGSEFGEPSWETRNISVADINHDGLPDIIVANRHQAGSFNYVCLNRGKGKFDSQGIPFAYYPTTTICPTDINHDGFIDLVVPNRDRGQSYVYLGASSLTYLDSRRVPFGPVDASIRMATVADLNGDKLLDILAIDEYKGVTVFFGKGDTSFTDGVLIADATLKPYALLIADMNQDAKPDIIVGHIESPSTIFFNDGTGKNFNLVNFGDAKGTVYGFSVGDFNEDGHLDIGAARSDATSVIYFGSIQIKRL